MVHVGSSYNRIETVNGFTVCLNAGTFVRRIGGLGTTICRLFLFVFFSELTINSIPQTELYSSLPPLCEAVTADQYQKYCRVLTDAEVFNQDLLLSPACQVLLELHSRGLFNVATTP